MKPEPQSKAKIQAQPVKVEPDRELDEETLDEISGGRQNMVFTSVSNVLKTRHDTAKNSINN